MKILMAKRKKGVYAQWFEVIGINEKGKQCCFLIYSDQARNYAQAVRFWNQTWGEKCQALYLRNAEPYPASIAC